MLSAKYVVSAILVVVCSVFLSIYYANPEYTVYERAFNNDLPSLLKYAIENAHPMEEVHIMYQTKGFMSKVVMNPSHLPEKATSLLCSSRDQYGNSVLHWAAKAASLGTTKYLLGLPCIDMYATNNAGSTALHWAATAIGPSEDFPSHIHASSPISDAAAEAPLSEDYDWYSGVVSDDAPRPTNPVLSLLISHHASALAAGALPPHAPNSVAALLALTNRSGESVLHWAVEWQSVWSVREMLYRNASVTATDAHGNTPLHKLYRECHADARCVHIVSLLVTAGAPTKAANEFGREALEHFDTTAARPTVTSYEQRRILHAMRGGPALDQDPEPSVSAFLSAKPEPVDARDVLEQVRQQWQDKPNQ